MPEGDTVYLTAKNLAAVMDGRELIRCDLRVPAFATVDLTGETVEAVVPRGKHLLMRIGEYTIHSHLAMEGSWHLYRSGSSWRRPQWQARAVLGVEGWTAVGFSLGLLEVVPRDAEDSVVGPDNQAHEVPGLYVADGSVMPTGGSVNPTNTIQAIALRAADQIWDARRD